MTKCPSTDDCIKKLWYIYTPKCFSAIKRNALDSVLIRWMNPEPVLQNEVREKPISYINAFTWNRKMVMINLSSR